MVNLFPPPETQKPYPFETLRHWYVTPFGGRSEELAPGQVGINAKALNQNTTLVPEQDRVLISLLGRSTNRPLYARDPFQVVALDLNLPDALQRSRHGEAVLPAEHAWDAVRRPHLQPLEGEALLLNSVSSQVLGMDPRELLAEALRRVRGRGSHTPQ